MTASFAGYQQSLAYTAAKDRAISALGLGHKALAVAESGVVLGTGGNLDVLVASGTTLNVTSGVAMIGNYKFVYPVDSTVVVANSTGVARRDLIIARVYDTENGDATSKSAVEVVQGTSTSDPAIPANSLILWQANIAAGGTVTVTDRRKFTNAAGGIRQVLQISDITYVDLALGCAAYDLATGRTYRRVGNSLVPVASGTPLTYTPAWTGDGGNPTASTITGRYTAENGVCTVWIKIVASAGGKGILRVGVPLASGAGVPDAVLPAKLTMLNGATPGPNGGQHYGHMILGPSLSVAPLMFPKSDVIAAVDYWQSSNNAGTTGTGIPVWTSNFSVLPSTVVYITGSYLL